MGRQYLRLTYPSTLVDKPIIYRLGREFGLVTNILRANVSKDEGWVALELQGDDADLQRAVDWARNKGVVVESLDGDLGR